MNAIRKTDIYVTRGKYNMVDIKSHIETKKLNSN